MKTLLTALTIVAVLLIAAPARGEDRKFWLLTSAVVGGMVADTHSTFSAIKHDCHGMLPCSQWPVGELNPLTAPIIKRGPLVTYPLALGFDGGVMWLSHHLREKHKWYWWVGPVVLGTVHTTLALTVNRR